VTITEKGTANRSCRIAPHQHFVPGLAVTATASAGLGMTAQAATGAVPPQAPDIAFAIDSLARMATYSAYGTAVAATASLLTFAAAARGGGRPLPLTTSHSRSKEVK
jgi:H+/gluconate symporter-like permease